ncbi:MAG: hypothetical protein HY909_13635 [Deltaproteobacteria bacterium]|nr:hypothetical protein [Deltaproteobacteria bacterium]
MNLRVLGLLVALVAAACGGVDRTSLTPDDTSLGDAPAGDGPDADAPADDTPDGDAPLADTVTPTDSSPPGDTALPPDTATPPDTMVRPDTAVPPDTTVPPDTRPPVDTGVDTGTDRPSVDTTPDRPAMDTAVDTAPDRSLVDSAPDRSMMDTVVDTGTDRPSVDTGSACFPFLPCRAYWCGCGRCNPAEITCVGDVRGCPLACPGVCPELATTACHCVGGTCTREAPGVDAGGGGGPGAECRSGGDCALGLLCCYPCGIPGCRNRCSPPDPRTGRCPFFP